MKKTTKKLHVPKETIRQLEGKKLDEVVGGAATGVCGSCGNRHSTCPV